MIYKKTLSSISLVALTLSVPDICAAASIVFNNFSDTSLLQLNVNAAAPVTADNVLRLVPAAENQIGTAFLKSRVALSPDLSFSSVFSFRMSNSGGVSDGDGSGGDGIMFVAQNMSNTVNGSNGGGMGYEGIVRSLGIEFDAWNNTSTGSAYDGNNGNHVGIDTNGSMFSVMQTNLDPGIGNVDRLNNGGIWTSWIDYDGTTDMLEVRLAQGAGAVRPLASQLSYTVDLAGLLETSNPYFGFTSSTGGAWGDNDILSWQLDTLAVPVPAAVWLFGSGLLGLVGFARRKKIA